MNCNIPDTEKKRIVIVGGGFGGLEIVNKLKDSEEYQIVLIDKNNYHQFPPLFYQIATAGLEATSITFPFRKMFQKHANFYFRLAEVGGIDFAGNRLHTSIGDITYDFLVLAAGTTTNFYGNKEVEATAYPMKSVVEALQLRNAILANFEKATITKDEAEKKALLNIVIAGGGPSGVEVAGALAEMKKFIMPKDYPELANYPLNIFLIEGIDRLLGPMSKQSSANAKASLEKMGVNIILNKKVSNYDGEKVSLEDGSTITSKTFIWVSGVTAIHFNNVPKEMTGRGGRFLVNEHNQVNGYQNVFAIGDICYMTEDKYPNGHPQVAQVSIQQGKQVAKNLKNIAAGIPMEPFHYKDLGTLATIGRNRAVADLGKFKMHGFPAWLVWLLVHLRSILGVKNKLMVLIDWIWNYFGYDQSERYILAAPNTREKEKEEEVKKEMAENPEKKEIVADAKPEDLPAPVQSTSSEIQSYHYF